MRQRTRRWTKLLGGLALCLLVRDVAVAQGTPTGKLRGRVTSEGESLPGVTVTVRSESLQGSRVVVSGEGGDYVLPNLPPGDYEVSFELAGMTSQTRALRVSAAQSLTLDVDMAVEAVAEEIVVTGRAEAISATSQGATSYSHALIDELPTGRTLTEIAALAPGIQETGFSKNSGTGELGLGSITISGASSFENLFLLNGVSLSENIRGQALDLFIEDAIEETTAAVSGISAEYGRFTGGVVNLLTKSGGNDFSGSLRTTFNNQSWSEETPLTTTQSDELVPVYEATLGGRVLRDQLWFFLAGRQYEESETRFTSITNQPYTRGPEELRYEVKLTGAITPSHNLVGSYMEVDTQDFGNTFGSILDLASVVDRELPQELLALSYNGAFGSSFFVTAQYSERQFTFEGAGSKHTDLVRGTLLIDRSRNGARYNSPTFCGVCSPEERDNENSLVKGSWFASSERLGSHEVVFGYDSFHDLRKADNHQSGSDYRILGTSAILRGSDVFPRFLPDRSTRIQFNPILESSKGSDIATDSLFLNDVWRLSDQVSLNLGLRYDRNDGVDAAGNTVADDDALSPRVGVTWTPPVDGDLQVHASYGKYVAAIANSIGDGGSSAGNPAFFLWYYTGPAINADPNDPNPMTADEALPILFDWFFSQGCPDNCNAATSPYYIYLPGLNAKIPEGSLDSPNATEYTLGASRRIGAGGLARIDYIHREFGDFYDTRVDLSTGQVDTPVGPADLNIVTNTNRLERRYDGINLQGRMPFGRRLELGGNYTWSHTRGNFDGETRASGPVTGGAQAYPEYTEARWNRPHGDLAIDQRHRASAFGLYRLLEGQRQSLSLSGLLSYQSGKAYSAVGTIDSSEFVDNPGYATPPPNVSYFFTGRGALRTPDVWRLDLSLNYRLRLGAVELLIQPEVINVTNEQEIDTTDSRYFDQTVFTASNAGGATSTVCGGGPCQGFDPFTETPIEGVHWAKGPNFGRAINPLAYQNPRTYRVSVKIGF